MPVSSQHDVTEAVLDDALLAWAVRDVAQALPGRLRVALYLTEVEGLSYAQAGKVMGIPERAVASDARRARGWMRNWLGPAIRRAMAQG